MSQLKDDQESEQLTLDLEDLFKKGKGDMRLESRSMPANVKPPAKPVDIYLAKINLHIFLK